MITKVEISNFQSHKQSTLEFTPGTNVIIGKSDAGKSAVFRAMNWVISNRPLGDSFRSEWGGDTKVTLYTCKGDVVQRVKSNNKNEYVINGKSLKAFGSEVPDEVTEILRLDSFNIHAQMDPPFLLSNTPGEAARLLNKAASIDDIDRTISGLKKAHTNITNNIKHDEQALAEYSEQIEQYSNLPEIEKMIKQVECLEEKKTKKCAELKQLENLTERIIVVGEELEESDHVPELLKKLKNIEQIYSSWQNKAEKARSLKWLVTEVKETKEKVARAERAIKDIEEQYHELAPEECPLCGNKMNMKKTG